MGALASPVQCASVLLTMVVRHLLQRPKRTTWILRRCTPHHRSFLPVSTRTATRNTPRHERTRTATGRAAVAQARAEWEKQTQSSANPVTVSSTSGGLPTPKYCRCGFPLGVNLWFLSASRIVCAHSLGYAQRARCFQLLHSSDQSVLVFSCSLFCSRFLPLLPAPSTCPTCLAQRLKRAELMALPVFDPSLHDAHAPHGPCRGFLDHRDVLRYV